MNTHQPMPPMPARIAKLPRDHRGFPIPWFVADLPDGTRDFRVADAGKRQDAVTRSLCWVCGERLGRFLAFVTGPMCVVTRVTSEPPCHFDCAEFSVRACPFLIRPRMRRNEVDLPAHALPPPGEFITRNPGVAAIYNTQTYRRTPTDEGGWLIKIGPPIDVLWFAEGRRCGRQPVWDSIESGMPALMKLAEEDGIAGVAELEELHRRALRLIPRA